MVLYIYILVSIGTIISPIKSNNKDRLSPLETYQDEIIVDGDYIGGLKGGVPVYNDTIKKKDYIVTNKGEFLSSLKTVKSGQVIYIKDGVRIDLTGIQKLNLPAGITIASGRGINKSKGAVLFTKMHGTAPLFKLNANNIRLTGLRLEGPDTGVYYNDVKNAIVVPNFEANRNLGDAYREKMDLLPRTTGVVIGGANNKVDNCELYGWTFAAISVNASSKGTSIHHNYIHHNQHFGLGYGVLVIQSSVLIKANLFDFNTHSVTSNGAVKSSYEVCFNVFRENHLRGWAVDMHGGVDRKDHTNIAGTSFYVHDNKFYLYYNRPGIVIRGVPQQSSSILNNYFYYLSSNNSINKYVQLRSSLESKVTINKNKKNSIETAVRQQGNVNVKGNVISEVN